MDDEQKKMGRPSIYTDELAKKICETLAVSTIGMRKLCAIHPEFPHVETIRLWALNKPDFFAQYTNALAKRAMWLAEDIEDIADDGTNDTYVNDDGKVCTDHDVLARSRLRVDTRKWIACKLLPKVYGDKVQVENDNGDESELTKIRELISKCLPKE